MSFIHLQTADFKVLGAWIEENLGVKMPATKRVMLETRLQKRLRALHMNSFGQYLDHLFEDEAVEELAFMVDLVTTHKTDFFREPDHFTYLAEVVLPELIRVPGRQYPLRLWSAGCSTGEEVYTLGMVLEEYFRKHPIRTKHPYSILGTDVSSGSVQTALQGIYSENRTTGIPLPLLKRYFLRSKNRETPKVRVIPQLRSRMEFFTLNFMDEQYRMPYPTDVTFYRNVMIYFDKPTQFQVLKRLCQNLKRGGYLFVGHSETLHEFDLPLRIVAPATYKRL